MPDAGLLPGRNCLRLRDGTPLSLEKAADAEAQEVKPRAFTKTVSNVDGHMNVK